MALQGFDKNYFLPQALAVLQEQDPDTWRGQNAAYLEEQLAVYNFTPQDLYEMWGWKYDLAPNRYFDPDYYMLALSKWAVDNKVPGCDNMTQAKAAVASALSGQDPYMHYLQYGTSMNINPSAAFDQSSYLENLLAWAKTAGHVGAEMTVAEVQEYFNQNGLSALGNYIDAGILVNIPVVPVPAGEIVTENASAILDIVRLDAAGADVMRLTGGQDVRIDFTNPANQIKGLDLNGDGVIANDGIENNITGVAANYEIVDAYARNPLNYSDSNKNFLGDINFDGTGFQGDGVSTNGNIFLGGMGSDTALGGIGNDFLTGGGGKGSDRLVGGRNADFFFAELSKLDRTDGSSLSVDGGNTSDDAAAGNNTPQDADWLLVEASDDDEPVTIDLSVEEAQTLSTREGAGAKLQEIENVDASGNLYGFLDDMDVTIGGRQDKHVVAGNQENYGIGSTAQLIINGSVASNILIGGYDNDRITAGEGNDIVMGGNLHYNHNPNIQSIPNDGMDFLFGEGGDDNIALELDKGVVDGGNHVGGDTLWLLDKAAGNSTVDALTTDNRIRLDLGYENYKGYRKDTLGENPIDPEANDTSTSNWVANTADQSNYKQTHGATTVTGMENIIATGLGAIDFRASGSNNPELLFNNQQNFHGLDANLDIRGTDAGNILYANTGHDKIEGRGGRDFLSGGNGNDDFVFQLQLDAGDGVDVIHRQKDANGDNIWDYDTDKKEYLYEQDFGRDSTASAHSSKLDITILNSDSTLKVGIVSFWVDGVKYEVVAGDLLNQDTIGKVADYLDEAFSALNPLLSVSLTSGNAGDYQGVITVTATAAAGAENPPAFVETPGSEFNPDSVDCFINTNDSGAYSTSKQYVGGVDISQDRLIYKAYEDRLDNEGVDDDSIIGSTISLGDDNYAEDLVVRFKADEKGVMQTMIAEDQCYTIDLKNITTEDILTMTVNGVKYELQVGKALDGTLLATEDTQTMSQAEILENFGNRFVRFINSFMDENSSSGEVGAAVVGMVGADGLTFRFTLVQNDYDNEETVFMDMPDIQIKNLSGGQIPEVSVIDNSQHSLHLYDFDGRNNALNETNVLFVGEEFTNRAVLETAKSEGGELKGSDAFVIDGGNADDLKDINHNLATFIHDNFAVHGDDLLIGGTGNDEIYGGTGDDRIQGSAGEDVLDGGKDLYAVKSMNQDEYTVETLNTYEAAKRRLDNGVLEVVRIRQTEDGKILEVPVGGTTFQDTLIYAQADFGSDTRFTITLDNDVLMKNGGAGTVDVDVDGDGTSEHHAVFTNFENIRTVSGTGLAVAGNGQGNDTLDVSALSGNSDLQGIVYDLTSDDATKGWVSMRIDDGELKPWIEEPLVRVDGVEIVKSGSGDDKLFIDQSEAAKDNSFLAGEGDDIIVYMNEFDNVVDQTNVPAYTAEPVVTINVGDDDTDTVVMTRGRVGTVVATDTLENVETIKLDTNTADGVLEADRLDVSALDGATVDYSIDLDRDYDEKDLPDEDYNYDGLIAGTRPTATAPATGDYAVSVGRISVEGDDNVLSVDNLYRIENVVAGDGDDTVRVADAEIMSANARSDERNALVSPPADLFLDTYLTFDKTDRRNADEDTRPVRLSVGELKNIADGTSDKTHDTSDIAEVINFGQFTFDLGEGADTVDYSKETGNIASVVEFNKDNHTQYVLVDGNKDGSYSDAYSRVDRLVNVDAIVASQGESIIDLTNSTQDLKITFSNNYDRDKGYEADYNQKYGLEVHEINVANATTKETVINMNYLDYVFVDTNLKDEFGKPENAVWNRLEGSDYAETVDLSGWEADENHTLNLRGGNNRVNYEGDSVEVKINVIDPDAANPDKTGLIRVEAIHTAPGDLHDEDQADDLPVDGTDIITSYSAQNAIAAGSLTIKGARYDDDMVTFDSGLNDISKYLILGGVIDATSAITVTIDKADRGNSINLIGFEILKDSDSDDVYSIFDLENVLDRLELRDGAPDVDRDTIAVNDEAATDAYNGGKGTETISLSALEARFGEYDYDAAGNQIGTKGFDFDILDISQVVNEKTPDVKLTVLGDAADFAKTGVAHELQEAIVGKLDAISSDSGKGVQFFDILSLTNASAGNAFNLNIDNGEFQNSSGTRIFDFDGNTLDVTRITGRDMTLTVTSSGKDAVVYGSAGNDTITGASGNDKLMGGAGKDVIDGGADLPEIHRFTLTDTDGSNANESFTINGVTVKVGDIIATGESPVAGNSPTAIGEAFVRIWNKTPEKFLDRDKISSVTYDSKTQVLSFTFNTTLQNVDNNELGAYAATGLEVDPGKIFNVREYKDNGADIFYAGAGADKVIGGYGDDKFVLLGKIGADDFVKTDLAGSVAEKFDAAVENIVYGQKTSDITADVISDKEKVTESINGGKGNDSLEIWGELDLTGALVDDVENIVVKNNSVVTLNAKQLEDVKSFTIGDLESKVVIIDANSKTTYDITNIDILNASLDKVAPTLDLVTGVFPADNAVKVSVDSDVVLKFSESVKIVTEAGIRLMAGTTELDTTAKVSADGMTVTIALTDPAAKLPYGADLNVMIASGAISDLANNAFAGITDATSLNFKTETLDPAPELVSMLPVDGATGVSATANIELTFNEAVTVNDSAIRLLDADGNAVALNKILVSADKLTVTIDPVNALSPDKTYHLDFGANAIEDSAGNDFTPATVLDFTTAAGPVTEEKVVDSLGTSSAHAVIDADGKDFIFKDDAAIQNFVAIEHFAKGDSILISNASASIYSISASGSDAVISYNNTAMGIVNEIILKGVLTDPSVLVSSEADLNKVLGFDAISDSGSITPVGTPQNADVGTITSVVTLSAAGDNFVFTDDAKVANGVLITGFEKGDSILVSNATASDYGVSVGAGGDAVISYNNTALNVVNEITLDGVIADPTVIISTPAELNAALGYNAITFA